MFIIYKDILYRYIKCCFKNIRMYIGNERKIRFWKYMLLVIVLYLFELYKNVNNILYF